MLTPLLILLASSIAQDVSWSGAPPAAPAAPVTTTVWPDDARLDTARPGATRSTLTWPDSDAAQNPLVSHTETPHRVRAPGVELAARLILSDVPADDPRYAAVKAWRRTLFSALYCEALDRELAELAFDIPGTAAADVSEALLTGIEPLACTDHEVAYIVTCLGEKPPEVCRWAYRVDAFVRAAEILGR
jgi:hypothetical protein